MPGIDKNTILLLHCNSLLKDEKGSTITNGGTATTSTTNKKFGTAFC